MALRPKSFLKAERERAANQPTENLKPDPNQALLLEFRKKLAQLQAGRAEALAAGATPEKLRSLDFALANHQRLTEEIAQRVQRVQRSKQQTTITQE